jgi:hypothetical protein
MVHYLHTNVVELSERCTEAYSFAHHDRGWAQNVPDGLKIAQNTPVLYIQVTKVVVCKNNALFLGSTLSVTPLGTY